MYTTKQLNQLFRSLTKNALYVFMSLGIMMGFSACSDDDDSEAVINSSVGESSLSILMTDAPGDFDEVNVDIQQIRVHSDDNGWQDLPTNSGVYNLLDFSNGIDTTLASGTIPSGYISQIRFVLGDSNSIVVDGTEHPLTIPSGYTSGLKLNVQQTLAPELTYSILVDFDAARSIVKAGTGDYKLKPVIKVIADGLDAAIVGMINPSTTFARAFAIQGQDTLAGAIADSLGKFTLNGLDAGTYDVHINPSAPYLNDTIPNITVTTGMVEDLGTITLSQ